MRIEIVDLVLPAFMKFLQDIRSARKRRECRFDGGGPFVLREVVANRDPAAAPGQFGKSGRLEDKMPLLLCRGGKIAPIRHGPAADREPRDHSGGRYWRRIQHPGPRHNSR